MLSKMICRRCWERSEHKYPPIPRWHEGHGMLGECPSSVRSMVWYDICNGLPEDCPFWLEHRMEESGIG